MSTKLGKITHIDNFKDLNFDLIEMKHILSSVGIIDSAIYFDEKANKMFIYLEIEDYQKYILASKANQSLWWSNLQPLKDIDINETPIDYAWKYVFHIKDEK